jgi:hypothetical protein
MPRLIGTVAGAVPDQIVLVRVAVFRMLTSRHRTRLKVPSPRAKRSLRRLASPPTRS